MSFREWFSTRPEDLVERPARRSEKPQRLAGAALPGSRNFMRSPRGRVVMYRVYWLGVARRLRSGRVSIPEGWTLKKVKKARRQAKNRSRKLMEHLKMTKKLQVEDSRVESALAVASEIMLNPSIHPRERLAAARVLLDNLHVKPVQKSETTVKTAEDWLAQVAEEAGITLGSDPAPTEH